MGWDAIADYYTTPRWVPPRVPPEPPKSSIYQDEEEVEAPEKIEDSPL